MSFKIEIWHAANDFEQIIIKSIDTFAALKFAKETYPNALKINIKKIK